MKRKILAALLASAILCACLIGCGGDNTPAVTDPTGSGTQNTDKDNYVLKVGTLKGPTGMGMAKLIKDSETSGKYEVVMYNSPDEIKTDLLTGGLDVAAIPANLAAVINAKTNGDYKIAAINTLGVLYIVENGNTVHSMADLAGKTIYATGQASSPEYILNYLLEKNGITDAVVEYKTEHSELAALMASGEVVIGMLPEPFVTTVLSKSSDLRIALNLTEEWDKVSEGKSIQGCLAVSAKAIAGHKSAVDSFLADYKVSVDYVNNSPEEASALIAELGIVANAALAKAAIPNCNIVYIDGDEMTAALDEFFAVLFNASPASVGGKLPDEGIYYKK